MFNSLTSVAPHHIVSKAKMYFRGPILVNNTDGATQTPSSVLPTVYILLYVHIKHISILGMMIYQVPAGSLPWKLQHTWKTCYNISKSLKYFSLLNFL